jgi:endonuclease YncB( thermonuclease family)
MQAAPISLQLRDSCGAIAPSSRIAHAAVPPHWSRIVAPRISGRLLFPSMQGLACIVLRRGVGAAFCAALLATVSPSLRPAAAQAAKPAPTQTQKTEPDCRLTDIGPATVRAVTEPGTLVLEDGRTVRLAGIEPWAGAGERQTATRLESLLAGKPVLLKSLGRETDRYGRLVAHIFAGETSEVWVQAALLGEGLARVGRIGDFPCAVKLLAHERAARAAKLGVWADPYYVMVKAEDPAEVLKARGRFVIVEGKVLSVRESGGTIYLNFGRRWSEDFTATVAKRNERVFTAAGLELKKLEARNVRIRGWVEERGGPWIEATRPEQIEVD